MTTQADRIRVALLAGGLSGEREVSLAGAAGVEAALDSKRYEVKRYDPATDIPLLVADAPETDVAFILLHGPGGEDGSVQGLLDLLGLPYQGSGVLGSALAMDKNLSKILYRTAGIPTAAWRMTEKNAPLPPADMLAVLGLPLVVKPARQGSSLGMSIVRAAALLEAAIAKAFAHDDLVLVEEYVAGREITGGVIGDRFLEALPLVEIVPGEGYEFFDYEAKYRPGASREICPAPLDENTAAQARQYAVEAHRALQLAGYSRTDMIVTDRGDIFVLETNTIPGMTPTSLLPQAAAAAGLSFAALLDRLIAQALKKAGELQRGATGK